jgi:hypothetical protein
MSGPLHRGYGPSLDFREWMAAFLKRGVEVREGPALPEDAERQWFCIGLVHGSKVKAVVSTQHPIGRSDLLNKVAVGASGARRREGAPPRADRYALGFVVCEFASEAEADTFARALDHDDPSFARRLDLAKELAATLNKTLLYDSERAATVH